VARSRIATAAHQRGVLAEPGLDQTWLPAWQWSSRVCLSSSAPKVRATPKLRGTLARLLVVGALIILLGGFYTAAARAGGTPVVPGSPAELGEAAPPPSESAPEDEAAPPPSESAPEDEAAPPPSESAPEDEAAPPPSESAPEDEAAPPPSESAPAPLPSKSPSVSEPTPPPGTSAPENEATGPPDGSLSDNEALPTAVESPEIRSELLPESLSPELPSEPFGDCLGAITGASLLTHSRAASGQDHPCAAGDRAGRKASKRRGASEGPVAPYTPPQSPGEHSSSGASPVRVPQGGENGFALSVEFAEPAPAPWTFEVRSYLASPHLLVVASRLERPG
jgi:hypothetical protein